jgi:hypothetical protein
MSQPKKQSSINFRLPGPTKTKFIKKALKYGASGSDLLREFIEAFNDDRLTVEPDPTKPSIYKGN